MTRLVLYSDGDRKRNQSGQDNSAEVPGLAYRSPFFQDIINLKRSIEYRRLARKTQLFPEWESGPYRNRLTHSEEVATIARDITRQLNTQNFFQNSVDRDGDMQIDSDIVEFASLAHDIGHPPFGHTGESVLDRLTSGTGGFEGNAQTLRVLCRLIKWSYEKGTNPELDDRLITDAGEDKRLGLNITYRSVASVLKYDNMIPHFRGEKSYSLQKGYYSQEFEIVKRAKDAVLNGYGGCPGGRFKTLECSIMDVADDIAYSTYDIEDALKSRYLSINNFLYPKKDVVNAIMNSYVVSGLSENYITMCLYRFIGGLLRFDNANSHRFDFGEVMNFSTDDLVGINKAFENLEVSSHLRSQFISWWINTLILSVDVQENYECPPLSVAKLKADAEMHIDILKRFVFYSVTRSYDLQIIGVKGERIIEGLFNVVKKDFDRLLPSYERNLSLRINNGDMTEQQNKLFDRLICDYIASMTDDFACEIYEEIFTGRIKRSIISDR